MLALVLSVLLSVTPLYRPLVFGLGGQSNASGRGLLFDLTTEFPRHRERLYNFGNDWILKPAEEPIDAILNQIDGISRDSAEGVGPGLAFAERLADVVPNPIVIVPCALQSTTVLRWQREYRLRRDSLYGSCIARMLYAAKITGGEIAGFIWYLGESDARNTATEVVLFRSRTQQFFDDLRMDMGDPQLTILFVQLHPVRPTSTDIYWDYIRSEQAALQTSTQLMVPALGDRKDQVHLATSAQLDLGRRLAEAYLTQILRLELP